MENQSELIYRCQACGKKLPEDDFKIKKSDNFIYCKECGGLSLQCFDRREKCSVCGYGDNFLIWDKITCAHYCYRCLSIGTNIVLSLKKKYRMQDSDEEKSKMRMIIRRYVKTEQEADNLSREIMEALSAWEMIR
jgi:DNA-directed RNA polymerase subunit RPC12/RpoP